MARAADGSVRDALSLLEQARAYCGTKITETQVRELLGVVPAEVLDELVAAIETHSAQRALALVHRLLGEGQNLQHFCREADRSLPQSAGCACLWRGFRFGRRARRRTPAAGASGCRVQRRRPDAIFSNPAGHGRRPAPQTRSALAPGNWASPAGECRAARAVGRVIAELSGQSAPRPAPTKLAEQTAVQNSVPPPATPRLLRCKELQPNQAHHNRRHRNHRRHGQPAIQQLLHLRPMRPLLFTPTGARAMAAAGSTSSTQQPQRRRWNM